MKLNCKTIVKQVNSEKLTWSRPNERDQLRLQLKSTAHLTNNLFVYKLFITEIWSLLECLLVQWIVGLWIVSLLLLQWLKIFHEDWFYRHLTDGNPKTFGAEVELGETGEWACPERMLLATLVVEKRWLDRTGRAEPTYELQYGLLWMRRWTAAKLPASAKSSKPTAVCLFHFVLLK